VCREGLTLIHRTPTCQKIPADFQEKLLNFQRYVIQLKQENNYALQNTEAQMSWRFIFMCVEFTLLTLEVQKKLKLETQIMKSSI
jgi:hypothetical protein